jgi:hypothetical protein
MIYYFHFVSSDFALNQLFSKVRIIEKAVSPQADIGFPLSQIKKERLCISY